MLKYGTLIKMLYSQNSLGNNQYPKTLEKAMDVLSMHNFDQTYYNAARKEEKTI